MPLSRDFLATPYRASIPRPNTDTFHRWETDVCRRYQFQIRPPNKQWRVAMAAVSLNQQYLQMGPRQGVYICRYKYNFTHLTQLLPYKHSPVSVPRTSKTQVAVPEGLSSAGISLFFLLLGPCSHSIRWRPAQFRSPAESYRFRERINPTAPTGATQNSVS